MAQRSFLIAVVLFALVGCERREGRPAKPKYDAAAAGRAAIAQYDADGNGEIEGPELEKSPALRAAIDRLNPTGHREVTSEMITAPDMSMGKGEDQWNAHPVCSDAQRQADCGRDGDVRA